jgi:hypothetical protein
MKKLIVALMLVTTVISCGKDNKVASGANSSANDTSAITISDNGGIQLGKMIDSYAAEFGSGTTYVNPYIGWKTWREVIALTSNLTYKYTKASYVTNSNDNCDEKWGFIQVCTYKNSYDSSSAPTFSRSVNHAGVSVSAKQAELRDIINRASSLYPIQVVGTTYYIRTTDGYRYAIDTRLPIQANPTGIQKPNNGETEYLYGVSVQ